MIEILHQTFQALLTDFERLDLVSGKLDIFLFFKSAYYCLTILSLRNQPGATDLAQRNPLASWFISITTCFGGHLMEDVLLGHPVLHVYSNLTNLVIATVLWYLVYFSPSDVMVRLCEVRMVEALLIISKEMYRFLGIEHAVTFANKNQHEGDWLPAILVGTARGSGANLIGKPLYQLVSGNLKPDNELLNPTFSTKHSLVTSVILLLQIKGVVDIERNVLNIILVSTAAFFQILLHLTGTRDPYTYFEKVVSKILFRRSENNEDSKEKVE